MENSFCVFQKNSPKYSNDQRGTGKLDWDWLKFYGENNTGLRAITAPSYKQPNKLSQLQNTQLNLLTVTFLAILKWTEIKLHWLIVVDGCVEEGKTLTITVKVHLTPNFFWLNTISVFLGVSQCKNFLNRSNPQFSVPLRSPTQNGSRPCIGDLGQARLWRQMENDVKVLSVITLFFCIFRRLSTTKIVSLGLHSWQNSEKYYNVLHFVGFRDELWIRRLGN